MQYNSFEYLDVRYFPEPVISMGRGNGKNTI